MIMHSTNLDISIQWLTDVVGTCLRSQLRGEAGADVPTPDYTNDGSAFARFIEKHNPTYEEMIVLLMALVPHVQPQFFDKLIAEVLPGGGDFPDFGGVRGTNHRGLLPTGETVLYVLGGHDIARRLQIQRMMSADHWFADRRLLWLETVRDGEPAMSGRLILDDELVEQLTTGIVSKPRFTIDFPAEYIETTMEWSDLVLHPTTSIHIREIQHWIDHNATVMHGWGMRKKVKPGYRALFYGPPGTGKTLTATLLGKHTGRDVFRIDLSRVVSKYIGETEKNLSKLFDKAEHKDWILFFDEADALFGKRTDIRDAHDKYANQEVAYLLQRIEGYNGLVILATNQRANIDDAFVRRFQSIVHFPIPRAEERYAIWTHTIPSQMDIAADVDWHHIAQRYEISGASIVNVAHYCALEALADDTLRLDMQRLETAIRREFVKEGKVV